MIPFSALRAALVTPKHNRVSSILRKGRRAVQRHASLQSNHLITEPLSCAIRTTSAVQLTDYLHFGAYCYLPPYMNRKMKAAGSYETLIIACGSVVVRALCYKQQDSGFNNR
jgi:hypothetical protein